MYFRLKTGKSPTGHKSHAGVVALRVKPGDPIHFEVRGRLTALMQPDPGSVSV